MPLVCLALAEEPEALPDDDFPEVVPDVLPLADLEVLALVVEALEVKPVVLLPFEAEPLADPEDDDRPLLLPNDVLDDEDDDGVLDDPLDKLDD